ncbi:MAG: hypothetical protein PUA47_01110 [Bacteroidales bacterium]|nr:hypothetical protein [Bacteroidales bacterium]
MLDRLKSQIEKLISAYEMERDRNSTLEAQAVRDREEIIALKAQIIELNKQIDSLKLTAAFSGNSTQDTGARQKVEQLIREIDKCIALMEE